MSHTRNLPGSVIEGVPAATLVPTAAPTYDTRLLPVLALVIEPHVSDAELDAFVARYRFAKRGETARAADSQARWMIENDGRVTVSFLAEDVPARIVMPPDPRVQGWAALARVASDGTLAVMVLPGLPSADLTAIGRRLAPKGGPYWHLSVGYVEA